MSDRSRHTDVLLGHLDEQQQRDDRITRAGTGQTSRREARRRDSDAQTGGVPGGRPNAGHRADGYPTGGVGADSFGVDAFGAGGFGAGGFSTGAGPLPYLAGQPDLPSDVGPAVRPDVRPEVPSQTVPGTLLGQQGLSLDHEPDPAADRQRARRPDRVSTGQLERSRRESRRQESRWRLAVLLSAVVLVLALGAYATRRVMADDDATLKTTGSTALTRTPAAAPTSGAPAGKGTLADLGDVKGVYTARGPSTAAPGSWAVLTLTGGGRHIVRTDTTAPFRAKIDTRDLPNGAYTLTVLLVNPGGEGQTTSRLLHVRNAEPSKPADGKKAASPSGVKGLGSPQAAQVVALTNGERAKAGCKPLTVDPKLALAAQSHSVDMAKQNYFDHNSKDGKSPFDRMTAVGYSFRMAAENIAMGQKTPAAVTSAWMNKANILNCKLTEIGVGYATNGGGTPYWTQDFGTPA